jgi:hypothetical protein
MGAFFGERFRGMEGRWKTGEIADGLGKNLRKEDGMCNIFLS